MGKFISKPFPEKVEHDLQRHKAIKHREHGYRKHDHRIVNDKAFVGNIFSLLVRMNKIADHVRRIGIEKQPEQTGNNKKECA